MTREVVNQNLIRIVGMARSGNHAIINWILSQAHGRWCFVNCVEPKSNPFATARPTDGGRCFETSIADFDVGEERRGRLSPKDFLLFSQEDCFLTPALGQVASAIVDEAVGPSRRRLDVLILRDPYNLFASRRRSGYRAISDGTAMRVWKQHAKAFLESTRYLTRPTLCISYNEWVRSKRYRQHIANALGMAFTDAGRDRVAYCGGGSSFDGYRFQGRAADMPVLDRWRLYADEPEFWHLFDPQVERLAAEIFGMAMPVVSHRSQTGRDSPAQVPETATGDGRIGAFIHEGV